MKKKRSCAGNTYFISYKTIILWQKQKRFMYFLLLKAANIQSVQKIYFWLNLF
jgi:hypothetical protein